MGWLAPPRILVIEESRDYAYALKATLERRGHAVEVATTGLEGVERARSFRPDVVICDLELPLLDGFGVAKRLRADASLHPLRLIAVSGNSGLESHFRAAGFDGYVPRSTAEVVAELLDHGSPLT